MKCKVKLAQSGPVLPVSVEPPRGGRWLPASAQGTAAPPTRVPTAPLWDMRSPGSVLRFLHALCLVGVCEVLLRHYSVRVCLYPGALADCIRHLQQL